MGRAWLVTGDIHLSDRPRDDYRFGLFRWLAKQQKLHNVDATFLLGDITQEKDKHSSTLVNRLIDEIIGLKPPIYIVRGNHDGIDHNNPFFRFLNCIEGITFAVYPTYIGPLNVGLIPHCRTQKELEASCAALPPVDAVFCHQTFDGALAETGARLSGLSASPIGSLQPKGIWAGDVHRPQTLGAVTYVGAPYSVRFGDDFTPRVLLIKDGVNHDLHFPAPRKHAINITFAADLLWIGLLGGVLNPGDQIKIMVDLPKEKAVDWLAQRREILTICKELGVDVFGIELKVHATALPRLEAKVKDHVTLIRDFCQAEKLPKTIQQAGLALIKANDDAMDRRT